MHEPIVGRLEEYLAGGGLFTDVEEHLKNCASCRKEVEAVRMQSALFRSLRATGEIEPVAGFYARVVNRIETQTKPSAWSLFGESLFAKRLAYASAMFVVLLSTVFFSSGNAEESLAVSAPEAILAGEEHPEPVSMENPQRDRDVILVNLATYRQDYQ
jgi:anti-sigma factor RsiW